MKTLMLSFVLTGVLLPLTPRDLHADALGLPELYQAALERAENLGIARSGLDLAKAKESESFGRWLPQVTLKAGEAWADGGNNGWQSPSLKLNAREDLLTGLDQPAALKGAPALVAQAEFEVDAARQALYRDLGNAYLNVLALEEQIRIEHGVLDNTASSVKDLRQRVALGRSRRAELSSAEAQEARVQATLAGLDGQLAQAREALASLVGLPVDQALAPPAAADTDALPALDEIARTAVEAAPSVRAARQALKVAEAGRLAVMGGFLPKVYAEGNWYPARQDAASGADWDANLGVDLPLFQGGAQRARLKQADAALDAARLRVSLAERLARQEARQAWQGAVQARARASASSLALQAAEKSAADQQRDFNNSLVTSLDLLQALNSAESARLDDLAARWDVERAALRLRLASGALQP